MNRDTQNQRNMRMVALSIIIFFACIIIVAFMSAIFGTFVYSVIQQPQQYPVGITEYRDHRLDFYERPECVQM